MQDAAPWNHKAPCLNGLLIPSDGGFVKACTWCRPFDNPRARKQECLDPSGGVFVPRGIPPNTQPNTQPKIAA